MVVRVLCTRVWSRSSTNVLSERKKGIKENLSCDLWGESQKLGYRGNWLKGRGASMYCNSLWQIVENWRSYPCGKIYVKLSTTSERFIGSCELGLMTHNSKASPFLWYFGRRGSSTRGRCGGTELKKSVVCCNRFQDQLSTMFVFLLLKCKYSLMRKLSILKYFLNTEKN